MAGRRKTKMWCNCCESVVYSDLQENEDGFLVCPSCMAEDAMEDYEGQDCEGLPDIYGLMDETEYC